MHKVLLLRRDSWIKGVVSFEAIPELAHKVH